MERTWPAHRGNPAGRWRAALFLRCAGPADYHPGRIWCRQPSAVGRRRPADPDDFSDGQHPRLQLRRLRPDHRRTRRTRAHHPLRI
nr:hypothetical protein [Pseudomonas fluorescens]